ncbi:MAG: autotransporter outer membrane beta-barrel domain-containing protein [Hyphomicrobiaceae bacterium]
MSKIAAQWVQFRLQTPMLVAAVLLAVELAAPAPARADAPISAGCSAVNSGGFNGSVDSGHFKRAISGFSVGDKILFVIEGAVYGDVRFTLSDAETNELLDSWIKGFTTFDYSVTGSADLTLGVVFGAKGDPATLTATCSPAGSNSANNDSQKLRSVQVLGSRIVAQNSGAAISGAADGAIGEALNASSAGSGQAGGSSVGAGLAGGANLGTASGLGGPDSGAHSSPGQRLGADVSKGFAQQTSFNTGNWNAWASLRYTDIDRSSAGGSFAGDQVNSTFGIGYRFSRNFVAGVLGGYEWFDYDVRSLIGTLKGDGWTAGAYAGWRIAPSLRWDLTGAYSAIGYDATAATAFGSFNGNRWILSSGLTGSYQLGSAVFEPSARVFAAWERQGSYIDNLGTLQGENAFMVSRASLGGRVLQSWQIAAGTTLVPYAGLYADHYISSSFALPSGQEALAIADGWSGRAVGGLGLGLGQSVTLSTGVEYGGIGADHKALSVTGRGALRF